MKLFLVFFISLLSAGSIHLLSDFYNNDKWQLKDTSIDNIQILETYDADYSDKFIRIEGSVDNRDSILNTIESISDYNNIVSNKNISSDFLFSNGDTLFCYQRISNSIPFIRDRQYIFKMYRVDNSRIDWYLVNENHAALQPYLKDDVRTLTYGAGSWKFSDDEKILIYRMYMDEEVNLPLSFIQKLRVNYALNIFNDVINWSKGDK